MFSIVYAGLQQNTVQQLPKPRCAIVESRNRIELDVYTYGTVKKKYFDRTY